MPFRTSDFTVIASGLGYPEGPIAMADGSIVLVELEAATLTRIAPDGTRSVIATLGGSPNGVAIGPDGRFYVCNSGGFNFLYFGAHGQSPTRTPGSLCVTTDQPPAYKGGSIQWVDGKTGQFGTLYDRFAVGDKNNPQDLPLKGPDDLVFDRTGGFWFTDWGKSRPRERDITGVFYAKADGSQINEVIFPLNAPNGIALSPDGSRLYVAETYTRRVLYWMLSAPGTLADPTRASVPRLLTAHLRGQGILDSMKVDVEGNVYVATMLPDGNNPASNGGISVISPAGEVLDFIETAIANTFEPLPSNLCFGGPDRKTAFMTWAASGRLVSCRMQVAGLPPAWSA
jgi:gluconolactonase